MKLEVLVASMHQKDTSLIEKMNLKTDALIGNQCDINSFDEYEINGHKYKYYSLNERGVGQNRNTILFRATGDVLTFADDDMIFVDNYEEIITKAFKELPDADGIIFNIETIGKDMGRRKVGEIKRVRPWNYMNYGAARLSVRNTSIKRANICFHREFGGGTKFSSGEDTLFIHDMLKDKLKIYVYPELIGSVNQETSTWFNGYNEKFFYDQGVFFKALNGKTASLMCFLMLLKHRKTYLSNGISFSQATKLMKKGREGFNQLKSYDESN